MKEIHWRIPFQNADGVNMCINIYAEGTPTFVQTLTGGAIWNGGIMETSEAYSDNPFDTLRFQTGTIHVANKYGDISLYDIMPVNATDRPVQLVRESDGEVMWQGFLSCEGYTQQYVSRPQIIDFNIKSVLKALEDQPIEDDFRDRHGELELNVADLIRLIVEDKLVKSECPFSITGWHYPDEYRFFQDYHLMLGMFYEEKEDIQEDGSAIKKLGGRTIGDIIEDICLYACVAVREFGTEVYMQPISENGSIDGEAQTAVNMRTLIPRGTEQTIKTDYPYKDLTLNLSPITRNAQVELPDSSEIDFNKSAVFHTPDQVSMGLFAWEYTKRPTFELNDIFLYESPFPGPIPIIDRYGTNFANDYVKCSGGISEATQEAPELRYAGAKLTKFRIREIHPENYDYNYGLGIIPYTKLTTTIPIQPQIYTDVIAKLYTQDFITFDTVNVNVGAGKRSVINIKGEVTFFYLDTDGYIKNLPQDKHWSLLCYLSVEDQFGNKEYITGYSENPQWSQNREIFHIRMEGNKVEDNYNRNYHFFNKTDGLLLDFKNDFGRRKLKITIELISTTALIEGPATDITYTPPCSLFMKELKIESIKDPENNHSEKKGRTIFSLLGGVEDHKNVNVKILTNYLGGDNNHISLLYKAITGEGGKTVIQPADNITYTKTDGTTEDAKPERVLFDRMVKQWSKPRRQLDLEVRTLDTPLPMLIFEGYDGKKYLPLCEKRDWGTCKSTITFFEVG